MWALVTDNTITKTLNNPKGLIIDDIQYSRKIFSLWSVSEKEAKGIYEVVFNDTNKKDEEYYTNTNQSFAFADGVVTASYGSATAKAHADTLFTAQDESDGKGTEGEVAAEGLKTKKIRNIKQQAASELARTDWYIVRKADAGTAVPSAITTHRAAVRTKCAEMETAITNAADEPALKTLTVNVPDPRSTALPVKFPKTTVATFDAVTDAVIVKSVTSILIVATAKSPSAAPVTVTSSAASLPSSMLPQSFVSEPCR